MTLALAVLAASLLGSVHCAAMCGAFVCFYASPGGGPGNESLSHIAYNLGRLVSYLFLGAIAGTIGHALNNAGALAGIQRSAAIVAGALMIVWGLLALLVARGIHVPGPKAPERWTRAMGTVLIHVKGQRPAVKAAATGLTTTLLPCGWLYTFVVTAAATGAASRGMLVMLMFWAGTLPVMLAVGLGARRMIGRFGNQMPLVSGALIIALGILSIAGRIGASSPHSSHLMSILP